MSMAQSTDPVQKETEEAAVTLEYIEETLKNEWREGVQQWLPRLLGISPLAILAFGIYSQGSPGMGLWMAAVLAAMSAALMTFYCLVHFLTMHRYRSPEKLGRLKTLLESTSKEDLWPKKIAKHAMRILTSSPFPVEAIDLNYALKAAEPVPSKTQIRIHLIEDLKRNNLAISAEGEGNEDERKFAANIRSINNKILSSDPEGNAKQIDVEGGAVHADGGDIIYTTNRNLINGETIFIPYSVSVEESATTKSTSDQYDSACIKIKTVFTSNTLSNKSTTAIASRSEGTARIQKWLFRETTRTMTGLRWIAEYILKLRVQFLILALTLALFLCTGQVRDIILSMVLDQNPLHFWMACVTGIALSAMLWHTSRQLTRLFPIIERRRQHRSNLSLERQGLFSNEVELFLFWTAWISLALFTTPIASEAFKGDRWLLFMDNPYINLFLFGAALILLGAALNYSLGKSDQPYNKLNAWFAISFFILFFLAFITLIVINLNRWLLFMVKPYILLLLGAALIYSWRKFDQPRSTWNDRFAINFFILFFLGLTAPIIINSISSGAAFLPNAMGSVALLFWALSLFLIIGTTLYQFSIITSFPLLSLLVIFFYFVNINRLNDNHMIRLISTKTTARPNTSSEEKNQSLSTLEEALQTWLENRATEIRNWKGKKKYPLYVISAQGGGIFAAYHSAKALAVLTDEIPGFSDHIFAISGVSGGSIGSAVYANALRNHDGASCKSSTTMAKRIDAYFEKNSDHMATILSSLLFGDMTQRIFPLPVATWDRSLGLELAFENGNASGHSIKLNDPFYETQDPRHKPDYTRPQNKKCNKERQAAPYLVLNTTEVSNGRRYILSPFKIPAYVRGFKENSESRSAEASTPRLTDADFYSPWLNRPIQGERRDLRFSTAAGLSARFPLASPYGFFPEAKTRRFIDGGLYDNSGAITAYEIIQSIKKLQEFYADKTEKADNNLTDEAKNKPPLLKDLLGRIAVYPIAIVDHKAVNLNSSYANPDNQTNNKKFVWFGWTAMDAVLSTREARIQKAVDLLARFDQDQESTAKSDTSKQPPKTSLQPLEKTAPPRRVLLRKDFRLAGMANPIFSVPLGWKLSCQARAFINDQIQPPPAMDRTVPWNANGTPYSLLPCEINGGANQAIQRVPVRPRGDETFPAEGVSISRPFWELIQQLKEDLGQSVLTNKDPEPSNTAPSNGGIPIRMKD